MVGTYGQAVENGVGIASQVTNAVKFCVFIPFSQCAVLIASVSLLSVRGRMSAASIVSAVMIVKSDDLQ